MKVERKPHEWEPVTITFENMVELQALKVALGRYIGVDTYKTPLFNNEIERTVEAIYRQVRYL